MSAARSHTAWQQLGSGFSSHLRLSFAHQLLQRSHLGFLDRVPPLPGCRRSTWALEQAVGQLEACLPSADGPTGWSRNCSCLRGPQKSRGLVNCLPADPTSQHRMREPGTRGRVENGCFAFDDGKDFCFVERVGTFLAHLASSPPSPAARLPPRDSSGDSACRYGKSESTLDNSNGKAQSKLPSLILSVTILRCR